MAQSLNNKRIVEALSQSFDEQFALISQLVLMNMSKLSDEVQKYFIKLNRSIVNLQVDKFNMIVIDRAFHVLFKLKKFDAFPKFCELNNLMAFGAGKESGSKDSKSTEINPYQGYITKDSKCYS